MVATLLRLKLRILGHTLRRETWRLVLLILGGLWVLTMVPTVLGGMLWLGRGPADDAGNILVIGGTLLVLGWAFVPVLVPGMDDSLEIDRFATLGRSARTLAPGLLVAGAVSLPALFTAYLSLAPVIAWAPHGTGPAVTAAGCGLLALVSCLLGARVTTSVMGRALSSRHARELGAVLGVVVAVLLVPAVLALGSVGLEEALESVPDLARVLGWTPFGAPFAAPAAAVAGEPVGAIGRVAVSVACVVVAYVAWVRLLHRGLVSPPSRSGQARRRRDGVLATRIQPRSPGMLAAVAVARRGLRYWTADPRYVTALFGAVLAPVLLVVLAASVADAPDAVALGLPILVGGTVGWGRHNDVAYDGSAFWLHVASRAPGWADRLGRAVAVLAWGLPTTLGLGLVGVAMSGRWDLAGAALGAGVGVLLGGLAVSSVGSALLPYPVPEAGASPFAAQTGAVGATLVAQLAASAGTAVVSAPVLALYAASLWLEPGLAWVTAVVGVLGGLGVLALGIRFGGRVYDDRAPWLLSRLG